MKQYMTKKILSSALMGGFLITSILHAEGDLSQKANDPTAPLMAVQLIDGYTSDFHNGLEGESANTVSFRAAYPYKWGESNHIARITIPTVTDSPSGDTGIQDMTLFDLTVFPAVWGRYGVGIVGAIPLSDGNDN